MLDSLMEVTALPAATQLSDDIVHHLLSIDNLQFKSQQIGENDLSLREKDDIVRALLTNDKSKFLAKFGQHLKLEHLEHFKRYVDDTERGMQIKFYYESLVRFHTKRTHTIDVRNRRYEALRALIATGTYFTEKEMMKRNPLLYDQLVGKYLTEQERKQRDNIDTTNISFVNVLMEGIERDLTEDRKQRQADVEEYDTDSSQDSNAESSQRAKNAANGGPFSLIQWNKLKCGGRNDDFEVEYDDEDDDSKQRDARIVFQGVRETVRQASETESVECNGACTMDTTNDASKRRVSFKISPKTGGEKKRSFATVLAARKPRNDPIPSTSSASNYYGCEDNVPAKKLRTKWGECPELQEVKLWKRRETTTTTTSRDNLIVSAAERKLLKEEFVSLMYQSFLDGNDDYDYSSIDCNEDYDNVEILERDAEDKYFESESPNDDANGDGRSVMDCGSSEDELDTFMDRLNRHPTVSQLSNDIKHL